MTDRWQPEPRARVVNVNIMPIAIDTFLIRFSTPFRHLYIWSRRFFGNILASISTIFDMIFDPFSASLHVESSIFRMHLDVDFDIFFTRFSIPFRFDTFLIRFSTPFSAPLHMKSSIFRMHFCVDFDTLFWHEFGLLFSTSTSGVVDFSEVFWHRFQHFLIRFSKMSARRSSLIAQMQLPLNTKSANPFPRCRCQTRKLANSIRVSLKTGNRVA